jgi:hypothetical protein
LWCPRPSPGELFWLFFFFILLVMFCDCQINIALYFINSTIHASFGNPFDFELCESDRSYIVNGPADVHVHRFR